MAETVVGGGGGGAQPPSAAISSPASGALYAVGQSVSSSFTCAEGAGGPGIASCSDQNGHGSGAAVDTTGLGRHTFTVTAMSADGQSGSASVSYTVAGAPSVTLSSPSDGAVYTVGQKVLASYSCQEGASGPGISSCAAPIANGAAIDTSTPGKQVFAVTASSTDGQTATKSVTFTVRRPSNQLAGKPHIKRHRDGRFVVVVKVPGPGRVDILVTAWDDNLAHTVKLLHPAPGRFVFARANALATGPRTLRIPVHPNSKGRRLVKHHTYRVTLRLWVTYAPTNGRSRSIGYYGLHLP
jgi:hypothetical protein